MRVAFLGLGIMGRGMAANLARKGHAVTVWNRTKSRAAALAETGVTIAATPAEATRGAEAIALSLADPPAVESAVFGAGGVVREQFQALRAMGAGGEDIAALVKAVRRGAGG